MKKVEMPLASESRISDNNNRENKDTTGQIYAINAPKIFLETLSARSTTLIFAVTYIAFIVGFSIDIQSSYNGFTSSDVILPGFGPSSNSWNGTVTTLANVISVSVSVQQTNVTKILTTQNSSINSVFDATIWACYQSDGCGNNFGSGGNFDSANVWHQVVSSKGQDIGVPTDSIDASQGIGWMIIPTTFQNQEAIPARGKVRSYYILVDYSNNPHDLFASTVQGDIAPAEYTINILTRPGYSVTSGTFSVILLFVVVFTLIGFIGVMLKQKQKWLTEQKWVCYYLAALILFINPIYCVIIWQQTASPALVFAFYFFDAMGQAAFFVVWLLFADNISRKAVSHLRFYGPKILIGFAIFIMTVVQLVYQFPNVSPLGSANSRRSPVQAVIDWTPQLQISFTAVSITVLVLMIVWTIYWLATLVLTGRKLRSLPYMNTRYLQLSYRFFLLQAYLLAAYFVFQYCFVIYFLLKETAHGGVQSIVELTDYLNTLSRQQTQLFGKVVFLTVYALVLTFLFLPASLVDNDLATTLASTYVLTEKERKRIERTRRLAISNVSHVLAGVVQKIVDAKAEVFCVETALTFCNISFEAYYDTLTLKTEAGYDTKAMDLKKYGYELIDIIYRPDHETFCIIARHETLNKLVVCFRGTSCKKHWSDNLNYTQRELELLHLAELDEIDGLDISGGNGVSGAGGVKDTDTTDLTHNTHIPPNNTENTQTTHSTQPLSPDQAADSAKFAMENPLNHPIIAGSRKHSAPPNDIWKRAAANLTSTFTLRNNDESSAHDMDDEDDDDDPEGDDAVDFHRRPQTISSPRRGAAMPRLFSFWKIDEERQEEDRDLEAAEVQRPSTQTADMWRDANEFISTGANTLGRGMNQVASTVAGATSNVVESAAEMVVGVAALTPGLKTLVRPQVHSGFWEAYAVVREDLHAIVRRELIKHPAHLYFVGHSLGGALATIAALDHSIHTVPRINAYLAHKRDIARREAAHRDAPHHGPAHHDTWLHGASGPPRAPFHMPTLADTLSWQSISRIGQRRDSVAHQPDVIAESRTTKALDLAENHHKTAEEKQEKHEKHVKHEKDERPSLTLPQDEVHVEVKDTPKRIGVRKVKVTMYNYGSPRVGNGFFALLYNRIVPDSFRTVIDGDLVTSMPPTKYRHIGTQAVVDNLGAGSIIIDPSFIERRLRTHTKSSVSVHSLLVYRKGLTGVKDAAEFMKEHAMEFQMDTDKFDAVRLALNATIMARNNSYALISSRIVKKKKKTKVPSKPATTAGIKMTTRPLSIPGVDRSDRGDSGIDFIPPEGPTSNSLFPSMGVLSIPCMADREGKIHGPLFAPLSEDSPSENYVPSRDGREWECNIFSSPTNDKITLLSGGDETVTCKDDGSPLTDEEDGDVDFEEAAHYANDLLTTQSLVTGMHQSLMYPLDSYFRLAKETVGNYTGSILNRSVGGTQVHGSQPGADLTSVVSPDYVTADEPL